MDNSTSQTFPSRCFDGFRRKAARRLMPPNPTPTASTRPTPGWWCQAAPVVIQRHFNMWQRRMLKFNAMLQRALSRRTQATVIPTFLLPNSSVTLHQITSRHFRSTGKYIICFRMYFSLITEQWIDSDSFYITLKQYLQRNNPEGSDRTPQRSSGVGTPRQPDHHQHAAE